MTNGRRHTSDRFKTARENIERERKESHERNITKALNQFGRKSIDDNCIPETDRLPTQQDFEDLYRQIYEDLSVENLPITILEGLPMTKTCIPTNHRETPETMSKISSMIFKRLSTTIPAPNIKLQSLLQPYAATRDGYGALLGMTRNLLPYLQPTTAGWEPEWTIDQDPSTYVASLHGRPDLKIFRAIIARGNDYNWFK